MLDEKNNRKSNKLQTVMKDSKLYHEPIQNWKNYWSNFIINSSKINIMLNLLQCYSLMKHHLCY